MFTVCATRFNILKLCSLPTECMQVFSVMLKIKTDFSRNNIKRLFLVMELQYVLYEVGTEFLNVIYINFVLQLFLSVLV